MYQLIGKHAIVHLYTREGVLIGTLVGRIADVSHAVEVAPGMRKDLAYLVDIETGDPEMPYRNSAGGENEGWFAIQDLEVLHDERPRIFMN